MTVEELVHKHLAWAEGIGRSMKKHVPAAFAVDDLISAARLGLLKAAQRYDEAKNDCFVAFAHVYVQKQCWMLVRRRAYKEAQHRALPTQVSGGIENIEVSVQLAQLAHVLQAGGQLLTERQRAIIEARFYADTPMAEIADDLGIAMTTAYTDQREALARLREHCEASGVTARDADGLSDGREEPRAVDGERTTMLIEDRTTGYMGTRK